MGYKMYIKFKKVIALIISMAVIICTAPAVPVFADGTASTKIIKQVNFGLVNEGITGIDKSKVTLSISQSFNKQWSMALSEVKEEQDSTATGWIIAQEKTAQSMEASVKGGKIILMEGYGQKEDYNSYSINAEHKKAEEVLSSATGVSAIVSKKDGEILYYGKINTDNKTNTTSSNFQMPKGLEAGSYNLYIFAEEYNSSTSPNTIYTSNLGNPVDVEVVPSLEIEITGLEEPEPGKEPDTEAVLKVKNGSNVLQEENIHVDWADGYGSNITGKFEYNREYAIKVNLEEYITGYIIEEEGIVKINGKEGQINTSHYMPTQYYLNKGGYKTKAIGEIIISGSVGSGNCITLKAYKGIIPPQENGTEYTYEWWTEKETSIPSYTEQSHVLTTDDFYNVNNGKIEVRLNSSSQNNVASKIIEIKNGYVETDIIEGVSKTDETIKGKSDGIIQGLTTDMAYSLKQDMAYKPCTSGKIEGLGAGTCYIKIDKSAVTTSGLNGIYACYAINEGKAVTLSFNSNGGNSVGAIEGLSYNATVTEPAQPVKAGYTFKGWYKDTGFESRWDFNKDKVTQDIELIAKWDKNPEETESPGNTNTPESTQTPGNTNTPESTQNPGNTSTPEGTQTPGNTNTPESTQNPGNTNTPESTQNPGNTSTPEGTQTPGNTNTPESTQTPGNTNIPESTQTPGNTNTPENTQTPGNTNTPEGTQNPGSTATKAPQGNSSPVFPYMPQAPQNTTNIPSGTQAPTQAETGTKEPVQTKEPENQPSQQPPQIQPSEAPGGQPSPQAPGSQPLQTPGQSGGHNTGNGNNTPQDNTDKDNNIMPPGNKVTLEGTEYKSTGNGNVTITGTQQSTKKEIIIPSTVNVNGIKYKVTIIGPGAFEHSKVQKIKIGNNVKIIDKGAFKDCKKLLTVKIPKGVTKIKSQAFKGCKELKEVKIKEGVKIIGNGAFKGCKKLTNIKLPSSVKEIGNRTFKNCTKLKKIVIGKEEKTGGSKASRKLALRFGINTAKVTIGASALENCSDLRSVVINSQVTKIGNSTFKYCSQLRKMLVKSLKLQKVGSQALKGVNNCKITVPPVKLKPYKTLFKNKGQGRKVVVTKG